LLVLLKIRGVDEFVLRGNPNRNRIMKRLVIESLAAWEKYRPSWQELTVHNVMLSCDWLQAWWKNYGGGHDLYIVALEHEGRLVSFVPWYKHRSRLGVQLRFLGSGRVCSDYLSAVCCPSQQVEARKTLMTHLRNTFASRDFQQEINGLKLEGFAADDAWLAELREMTTKLGYTSRTTSLQNAWRIPLPSTWEQFVTENKSKSLARKIKRCESRLRSGQVAIQSIESLAKLEEAMACFRTLHRSRRESVGDGSCFDDIRFEPFLSSAFASLLDQGKARFLICEAAGMR
jgi:CelD/BcsL family acetyltransferase involved in cellulose biosynthesis